MLSFPYRRTRAAVLCLASLCLASAVFASLSTHWQAATAAATAVAPHFVVTEPVPDKGAITPASITVTVNDIGDAPDATPGNGVCETATGNGVCTLRAAITETNAVAGANTINFAPGLSGQITPGSIFDTINHSLTINGPGANSLTVSGSNNFRVFNVALSSPNVVTISGLNIANGRCQCAFGGGGIVNNGDGTLNVMNSTIRDSSTFQADGGGISNAYVGTLNVINSTLSGNSASQGNGAGISNVFTGTVNIINSTLSNNSTTGSGSGGGGISNIGGGQVKIRNSIIAGNTAPTGPDVSGPVSSQGHNLIGKSDGSTGFTNGVNGDIVGAIATPVDPRLAPLGNNGGPTQTMALMAGSPAFDAGDDCVTQAAHCGDANIPQLTTDQRGPGFSRIVDGPDIDTTDTVDIGAFEAAIWVEDIPNKQTNEDTQLQFSFTFGGAVAITSVTATSGNATLVPNSAANIALSGSGTSRTLMINPAADQFGTATITVTVNGPNGQSMTDTFLLTVNAVNDAPSFTKGSDPTVNEDAGAQSVPTWATSISAGPNEGSQTLTFGVTGNTNPALFAIAPAISSTGTLTYTPAVNANGSATITITLKDNGGVANGGIDTSTPPQTLTITVNSVNDAPSFTKGSDQFVNNNTGAQTVANWATNISKGPANESSQTVTFQVTNNTNAGVFSVAPSISATGTLTYTPVANANGLATITIVLNDNGGTANGGVNTSEAQTFNITVNSTGGSVSFSSPTYGTTESSGSTTITVKRTGDLSRATMVDYKTSGDTGLPCSTPGAASPKCDFTSALGTLKFAIGEDTKTFTVLISQDSFVEGSEPFTLTLSNPTGGGAVLATPSTATVTIADDDVSEPSTNAIDDASNFVRQNYHDFLNREPDASGLAFWTNQITSCGSDQACIELRRINVSGAFFLSIEFQGTGYLVERLYKTSYGDVNGPSTFGGAHQLPVPIVRFNEFLPDTQEIGQGVVVGQPDWEMALENNKVAFVAAFVQRARFTTALPTTRTPIEFVNALFTNAGLPLSGMDYDQAIADFGVASNTANVTARASALRRAAENSTLQAQEFNRAFVLMQYFGYMRRNPNDPQDTDYSGYDFWLSKLNQFNGNFVNADMVKAFITSSEYRQHFGP